MHVADTLDKPTRTEAEGRRDLAEARARVLPLTRRIARAEARFGDECPCAGCRA